MRVGFLRLQVLHQRITSRQRHLRQVGRVTLNVESVRRVVCALGESIVAGTGLGCRLLRIRLRSSSLHVLRSKLIILLPERSFLYLIIIFVVLLGQLLSEVS